MPEPSESFLESAAVRFEREFACAQAFVQEAETGSALDAFSGCITWVEELLRSNPANRQLEQWLAISYASQAEVLAQTDQVQQALEAYEHAVALFKQVRQRAPSSIPALSDLVRVQRKVLDVLMESNDRDRAGHVALELEKLLGSNGFMGEKTDPSMLELRASGHSDIARCFQQWGPKHRASWHQAYAVTLLEKALSYKPDDEFLHLNLAITCLLCGQSHDGTAAAHLFEKSYGLLKALQMRIELPPEGEQALEVVRRSLGWEPLYGRMGPPNRVVRLG